MKASEHVYNTLASLIIRNAIVAGVFPRTTRVVLSFGTQKLCLCLGGEPKMTAIVLGWVPYEQRFRLYLSQVRSD